MNGFKVFKYFILFSTLGIVIDILFSPGYIFIEYGIISLLIFIIFDFYKKLGSEIPILYILGMASIVQWIFIPFISQQLYNDSELVINYNKYLEIVTPGVIFFLIGLLWSFSFAKVNYKEIKEKIQYFLTENPKSPFFIFYIGIFSKFLSTFLPQFLPSSFYFALYLLGNLAFVGGFYFLFSNHNKKWFFFGAVFILELANSIITGMYGQFAFWAVLSFIIIDFRFRFTNKFKLILFFIVLVVMPVVQIVKREYRSIIWLNTTSYTISEKINLFSDLFIESLTGQKDYKEKIEPLLYRLNQARINSAVIKHMNTSDNNYAGGETIFNSLPAIFIPRIIWPDKPTVDNDNIYERFTGWNLVGGTSMSVSPVGEGYGNFGKYGMWLYLFLYGLLLNYIFHKIIKISKNYPTLILWLPLIFLQVIKAETFFLKVANHLTKSIILTAFLYFIFYRILKKKI